MNRDGIRARDGPTSAKASDAIALTLGFEQDADDGELTRTRKVRRGVINEKYADIIQAVYDDVEIVPIDTTIVFQDGTKQRIKTSVRVVDLSGGAGGSAKSGPRSRAA